MNISYGLLRFIDYFDINSLLVLVTTSFSKPSISARSLLFKKFNVKFLSHVILYLIVFSSYVTVK